MSEQPHSQVEQAARLQQLLLDYYEQSLVNGSITSTDVANLQRLLITSGWTVDERMIPKDLKARLTKQYDPKDLDDDVVGRIA